MTMTIQTMKTEIISALEVLPPEKLMALLHYTMVLRQKSAVLTHQENRPDMIEQLLQSPLILPDFTPLTREDIFAR